MARSAGRSSLSRSLRARRCVRIPSRFSPDSTGCSGHPGHNRPAAVSASLVIRGPGRRHAVRHRRQVGRRHEPDPGLGHRRGQAQRPCRRRPPQRRPEPPAARRLRRRLDPVVVSGKRGGIRPRYLLHGSGRGHAERDRLEARRSGWRAKDWIAGAVQLNALASADSITAGQKLQLPASGTTQTQQPPAVVPQPAPNPGLGALPPRPAPCRPAIPCAPSAPNLASVTPTSRPGLRTSSSSTTSIALTSSRSASNCSYRPSRRPPLRGRLPASARPRLPRRPTVPVCLHDPGRRHDL